MGGIAKFFIMPSSQKINRIQDELDDQGRTQTWLAKKVGVSNNTVSSWCTNQTQPGIVKLKLIAYYLGVKMSDLLIED